jgi:DNA-binding IclR family transcriptional regulator
MSIENPTTRSPYFVEAVDRALNLLLTVSKEADLGVSEIARRSGDSKARAFRLLHTLEARGFLMRSEDGIGYRLGFAALAIGNAAMEHLDIVRLSRPVLAELGEKTRETIQLRVRDRHESICVAKWEPGRDIQVNAVIGRRRPLHVGSSKVLLAYLDEAEREAFLRGPLERFTPNTIVDPKQLQQKIEQIRLTGMQVSRGEVTEELISITAPVFGADGRVAATLNVAAPANRVPESRHAEIGQEVKNAARRISHAIGFRG